MEQQTEGVLDGARDTLGAVADRAKSVAGQAVETVEERAEAVVDTVRGTTGNAQATLADAFDSSAQMVRERVPGGPGEAVAGGLESAALWLRETDLSDPAAVLRQQLREHPGRTAALALVAGILIGRATTSRR